MQGPAPDMDVFALYVLLPMLIGALGGALTHPENRVYGVFVGGIVGALLGLLAMIGTGKLRE